MLFRSVIANNAPECKNYLQLCKANEVGCDLFTPTDKSPSIPALVSTDDLCPGSCVGLNTYLQKPAFFDPTPNYGTASAGSTSSLADVNFIPTTAQKCQARDAGCEEFTNVEAGEQREYYTELRQCIKPSDVDGQNNKLAHTYYTWVGSNLTGYQLKTWLLKDRKSTRLNSSHVSESRMPSSA